jgi:SAM-dependent methyltransferase
MPDLEWNQSFWGKEYGWSERGDEWSVGWGGSEAQWFGTLYPRLHRMIPARRILEIAPGRGRWTQYLIPMCSAYIGIDIAESCVVECSKRFANAAHAGFIHNDGLSLAAVPDESFDFIFSFDSLVHAEFEVLQSYIPQIVRKLAPGGKAFLHHSNFAACNDGRFPAPHSRAMTVSGEIVANLVRQSGGKMLVSELVDWGPLTDTIDCFSTFARGDDQGPEHVRLTNSRFMQEAAGIHDFQSHYSRLT